MNMKSGLMALGLFGVAAALTISCGGSSDDGGDSTPKAGSSSSSSGSGSGGNGSNTGGNGSTTAGTTASNGGTDSNSAGGDGSDVPSLGGRSNNGGSFNFPVGGDGGIDIVDCPKGAKSGDKCTDNCINADGMSGCVCAQGSYFCVSRGGTGGAGSGGANGGTGGVPSATCPANAKTGDSCTGFGVCTGSQTCGCLNDKVYCAG